MAAAERALRSLEALLWPRPGPRPRGARERIGVLRVGMIGDSLAALPAIQAVRETHPDAEVVLLTSPGVRGKPGASEVFATAPAIDRLLVWHADEVAGPRGQLGLLRRLRGEAFDRIYLLPQELTTPRTELRNLLFLRAAGVGFVRGTALSHAGWMPGSLARAHHREAHFEPEWARLLQLVERAGASTASPTSDLGHDAAAESAAEALIAEHGLAEAPLLALGPGQNRELKRWPAERFAAIGRRWIADGGRVCVLGGPGERSLGSAIARSMGADAVNLCGAADLPTSAALLRRVDALVSNDTGTMHLAAAVGCPTVAVFSGWDRDGSWDPFGEAHRSLRAPVPCAPCFAEHCSAGQACLVGIETERVWSALLELLGDPRPGRSASREAPAQDWDQGREPPLPSPKRPRAIDR